MGSRIIVFVVSGIAFVWSCTATAEAPIVGNDHGTPIACDAGH